MLFSIVTIFRENTFKPHLFSYFQRINSCYFCLFCLIPPKYPYTFIWQIRHFFRFKVTLSKTLFYFQSSISLHSLLKTDNYLFI